MVAKLGSAILETLKPKGKKAWEKFLAILASVRSGISFDINGQPSWTMSVGDIQSPTATLDEIFSIAASATIGYHSKPVILYNMKGFWDGLVALLDDLHAKGVTRKQWRTYIKVATSLEEVATLIEQCGEE
jgi:hypothetical protein